MHATELRILSLYCLRDLVIERTCSRRAGRPFDHCSDSADVRECMARAVRVYWRLRGARWTVRQCASF